MDERVLRAVLRFGLDKESLTQVQSGALKVEDALQKVAARAKATQDQMNRFREQAERLSSVSMAIAGVGGAVVGSLVLAAKKYVDATGESEATSRRWLAATKDLEQSQMRVGRVAAEAVLPVLERAAEVAEAASRFAQAHPEVMAGILKVGTAVATVGAIGIAVSRGIRLVADVKSVLAAGQELVAAHLMNQAADKNLAAAGMMNTGGKTGWLAKLGAMGGAIGPAMGVVGSVLGGAATGLGVNELLARLNPSGPNQTFGKWATVGAYTAGRVFDTISGQETDIKARKMALAIAYLTGEIDKSTAQIMKNALQVEGASGELKSSPKGYAKWNLGPEAVNAYIAYRKAEAQAEAQYSQERNRIVAQYGRQRADLERQYEAQRNRLVEDFNRQQAQAQEDFSRSRERALRDFAASERQAERDYYSSRAEAVRSHNKEVQRAEEDHQRRMRDLAEDHDSRMEELAASGDALGMVREQRDYEKQRRSEEDSFQTDMQRQDEDYAEQLAEMEAAFAEQRASRLADFQQRLQDEQADFDERRLQEKENLDRQLEDLAQSHRDQLAEMKRNRDEALAQLKDQHDQEKAARNQAFQDQLYSLGVFHEGQLKTWNTFYDQMGKGLVDYMNSIGQYTPGWNPLPPPQPLGGRRAGGYVSEGLWQVHDREYVLNPDTTHAAERLAGGSLTQERVLAGLAGGGGRPISVSVYQHGWRFEGSLTAAERKALRQMAQEAAETGVLAVIGVNA